MATNLFNKFHGLNIDGISTLDHDMHRKELDKATKVALDLQKTSKNIRLPTTSQANQRKAMNYLSAMRDVEAPVMGSFGRNSSITSTNSIPKNH